MKKKKWKWAEKNKRRMETKEGEPLKCQNNSQEMICKELTWWLVKKSLIRDSPLFKWIIEARKEDSGLILADPLQYLKSTKEQTNLITPLLSKDLEDLQTEEKTKTKKTKLKIVHALKKGSAKQ